MWSLLGSGVGRARASTGRGIAGPTRSHDKAPIRAHADFHVGQDTTCGSGAGQPVAASAAARPSGVTIDYPISLLRNAISSRSVTAPASARAMYCSTATDRRVPFQQAEL